MSKQASRRPRHAVPERGFLAGIGEAIGIVAHDCHAVEIIEELSVHRDQLDGQIAAAIAHARDEHSTSWQAIGDALGITKQGAMKRYGKLMPRPGERS